MGKSNDVYFLIDLEGHMFDFGVFESDALAVEVARKLFDEKQEPIRVAKLIDTISVSSPRALELRRSANGGAQPLPETPTIPEGATDKTGGSGDDEWIERIEAQMTNLCFEIEHLPASEQQTKVSVLASQLVRRIRDAAGEDSPRG